MKKLLFILFAISLIIISTKAALALEQAEPWLEKRMKTQGTWNVAESRAKKLGNYKMRAAKIARKETPQDTTVFLQGIDNNFGKTMPKVGSINRTPSSVEKFPAEYDLTRDGSIDERDVLALGFNQPRTTSLIPSIGNSKTFILLIDFDEYPHWYTQEHIYKSVFGSGDTPGESFPFESLTNYYNRASYNALNLQGTVFEWYKAKHPRSYYHPDDSVSYPGEDQKREELFQEAILAADAKGHDFSQYDGDGDGVVDGFSVIYAGPQGDWSSFWWGYMWNLFDTNFKVDGVTFSTYSFQWEQRYDFGQANPKGAYWSPYVLCHETGHMLGLPDYYDYANNYPNGYADANGGVGGLDEMHGNTSDHNSFNKWVMGWLYPDFITKNETGYKLYKTTTTNGALAKSLVVSNSPDPLTPFTEYFMVQNRRKEQNDAMQYGSPPDDGFPGDGLLIWHVDARLGNDGYQKYDNSYTWHKILRLMEADGSEEVKSNGTADTLDYWTDGKVFQDDTKMPSSRFYPSSKTTDFSKFVSTGIKIDNIKATKDEAELDITVSGWNGTPPTIDITSPSGTVNGKQTISIDWTAPNGVKKILLMVDREPLTIWTAPGASPVTYSWYTQTEFNGAREIEAWIYDNKGMLGKDVQIVTLNNSGVNLQTDSFETDLNNWKNISPKRVNDVFASFGEDASWQIRTMPDNPTPYPESSKSKEVWLGPTSAPADRSYPLDNILQSQRLDFTAATKDIMIQFWYRGKMVKVEYTADEGATWTRIITNGDWQDSWSKKKYAFSELKGKVVYIRFICNQASMNPNADNGLSCSLDDVVIKEANSNAPTAVFTNPLQGETISDTITYKANCTDDIGVVTVYFFINGNLEFTDTEAPYEFTWDSTNYDNHPYLPLTVYSVDGDGIASKPDNITVVLRNPKNFPVSTTVDDAIPDEFVFETWDANPETTWSFSKVDAFSPDQSLFWGNTTGAIQTYQQDRLFFVGPSVSVGRRAIDLSHAKCTTPVLRFVDKGTVPGTGPNYNDGYISVYFSTTWGDKWLGRYYGTDNDWIEYMIDLNSYKGYSGQILFYMWTDNINNGSGYFLDDIRVENYGSEVTKCDPNEIQRGEGVTLTGTSFGPSQSSSRVVIGSLALDPSYTFSWSNEKIVTYIPHDAQTGTIFVRTGLDGQGVTLTISDPLISSIIPNEAAVGEWVTISGKGFYYPQDAADFVYFNGTKATVYNNWTGSKLEVQVPIGATDGPVKIQIAGKDSNTKTFNVKTVSAPNLKGKQQL